jgi:light-regulated signal transduction histidine kinase (bacteriophytochrome)
MEKSTPDRICVQVFAKVSAAISHEIKNTLSIINENAGLLDDYAHMAEQTGGLPIDRVLAITSTIAKQVDRSNIIMKNLNRYAHSGDTRLAHANLKETLSLVTALASRQAAMKEIDVTVDCLPDIAIYTHLMSLESLIYLTLLSLYEDCEAGNTLTVQGIEEQENITVCFTIQEEKVMLPDTYPDDDQQLLAEQVSCSYRHEKNQLSITFPGKVACHTSS